MYITETTKEDSEYEVWIKVDGSAFDVFETDEKDEGY